MRETGLEADNAVDCQRPCFKASSGDHPKFKITVMTVIVPPFGVQASFFSSASKTFLMILPSPAGDAEKAKTNRIFHKHLDHIPGIMRHAHTIEGILR